MIRFMKRERQLAVLIYLCRHGKATAPELAEHLEVSRRTVNRDMEALCMAGVPLITTRGQGGGISLPEGYVLERGLFPADEMDLHSFYGDSQKPKIALIQEACRKKRDIRFTYYSDRGISEKRVHPLRIIFRWGTWYMRGFCRERQAYRLYKLNRLWNPETLDGDAPPPPPCPPEGKAVGIFSDNYLLKALFKNSAAGYLVEEYGPSALEKTMGDKIYFEKAFANYSYMKRWVMGFGEEAEVLEPAELREEVKSSLKSLEKMYFSPET